MSTKKSLTNENLCERFENPFTLVKHAIEMARNLIMRGDDLDTNPANRVLDAIAEGRDDSEMQEEARDE